jgi:small subunit ribosomal protein S17
MPRRILNGKVCKKTGDKTISVLVATRVLHPLYKKYIASSKKYLAHDPENKFQVGDVVSIIETKPYSARKTWCVLDNGEVTS